MSAPQQPLEPDLPGVPVRSHYAADSLRHEPATGTESPREQTEAGATRPRPANGGVQRG
ncbi:hypothetical protein ABIA35_002862 [Catenulispora sp. MAP12-49]